ncbi:catalase-like [Coccinella septempunctata]|uniref:catalase-like n=1 Tax=Coccinella septempunctata TaxID=41139 RepID=UPI001D0716E7|nr:catalase-like [Coccinella septempunctata]
MFWDFMSLRPETMSTLLRLFSNTGLPDGWRRMDSYPANVYKLVNFNRVVHYCKFSFECKETKRYLSTKDASRVEPDYFTRDLFNAIERHNYPSWILYIQVMTEGQAMELLHRRVNPFDPFDNTKVWPSREFPRTRLGMLNLTSNPTNHFAEIEQLAFAPANMVPGIEPSAYDKILQGRIFAYPDAQRYRLGPNYQQLGPNRPLNAVRNYQRDGPQTFYHQGDEPNYHPNTFLGPPDVFINKLDFKEDIFLMLPPSVYDDVWQNQQYLDSLGIFNKQSLAKNIANSLGTVTDPEIKNRMLGLFSKIDRTFHMLIKDYL